MHKKRRRPGGSHGRRNLPRHMARFPHAGNHNAARDTRQQPHRTDEAIIQTVRKRTQRIRFQRQHAAAFGKVRMGGESIHGTLYEAAALKGQ